MATPAVKKNKVTILKGTPNEKSFYFENPTNPTANDIAKVKEFYGISQEASPEQVIEQLNKFKSSAQANILQEIPFDPVTESKEYYNMLAQKMADTNERMKLIEDPANYLFKSFNDRLPKFIDMAIPDSLVSKPTFEALGSFAGMGTAGLLTAPAVVANPAIGGPGMAAAMYAADSLGSQAGGQVYELTNQILRHLNDLPLESREMQNAKFLQDAYMNLAFTGGAMSLGPMIKAFKPAVGRVLFGLDNKNPEFQKMLDVADTYGMPLGIIQATNSSFWKGYSKVLGVFPFIGTPFRRAGEGTQEGIRQYFKNASANFAPFQTMASLGGDVMGLARKEYKDTMTISGLLYENFENYAKKLEGKKVIKVDTVKRIAKDFEKTLLEQMPTTPGYQFKFPGEASERSFRDFYQTLTRLDPEGITIQQGRKLMQLFSEFASNYKNEGKGIVPTKEGSRVTQLKLAMEQDMNKLVKLDDSVDQVVFDEAIKKLTIANAYLADVMPKYKGAVPNMYKQVNANIFGPGPQSTTEGAMYAKDALNIVLEMAKDNPDAMKAVLTLAKTPKANLDAYYKAGMKEGVPVKVKVQQLDENPNLPNGSPNPNFGKTITVEQVVKSMAPNAGANKIMRKLFDDAFSKSLSGLPVAKSFKDYKALANLDPEQVYKQGYKNKDGVYRFKTVDFDPMKFADELGLNNPDKRMVLESVLQGTGTKIKDIERFLEIAERSGSFTVTDPSTFVQRRVTLGGFKSLILFSGAQAGATMAGFGLPMLMVPLLLRYGSSILTDPKVLKAFSQVLADTGEDVAKRSAVLSTLGKGEPTKEDLKKFTISKENQKILLDWANATLPTQEDLDQMDFVNQVEQSIMSLAMEPQKSVEQRNANENQRKLMDRFNPRNPRGLTKEEAEMGNIIQNKLQPTFTSDLGGGQSKFAAAMQDAGNFLRENDPITRINQSLGLNQQTRNNLAFGTIDDAMASQYGQGGIGDL